MSTHTSSYEAPVSSRVQRRNASRAVGYSVHGIAPLSSHRVWTRMDTDRRVLIDSDSSTGLIASDRQSALTDDHLVQIAERFCAYDLVSLDVCRIVNQNIVSGSLNANDPGQLPLAQSALVGIIAAIKDLQSIKKGELYFHKDFLSNAFLLEKSQESFSLLSQMFMDDSMQPSVRQTIDNSLRALADAPDLIVNAAGYSAINSEASGAIRRRWGIIRESLEGISRQGIITSDDLVPPWRSISLRIEAAKTDLKPHYTNALPADNFAWLTILLWATFLGNSVLTIPFLFKALQYSAHKPGTRQDADFWFLLQGCVTQSIGLLVSSVGLWKQASLPIWAWAPPSVLAVVSNIVAVCIYDAVSTEWSALCVVFGGAIQSYMVLQLAIAGH